MADVRCPRCGSKKTSTTSNYKFKKGLGYTAEFAAGFGLQYLAGDIGGALAENISIADNVGKEWECNNCKLVWKENEQVEIIPDSFIQQYKDQMYERLRMKWDDVLVMLSFPSVCALITYGCWWYCHTYDYSFMWFLLGLLMIVFGIMTIVVASYSFEAIEDRYNDANKIKKMTLKEFKASKYFLEVIEEYERKKKY